ncbi:MAG: Vps62-related protein [Nannocystis sp.]|nr:Vps62-related protein [Nannocystis sp.]
MQGSSARLFYLSHLCTGALIAAIGCAGGDDGGATSGSTSTSGQASAGSSSSSSSESSSSRGEGGSDSATTGDSATSTGAATEQSSGSSADPSTGDEPADPRLEALITYAPRVWLHSEEQYFPSSVEFAFAEMTRSLGGDGRFWIRSKAGLGSPSDTLPFFAGELATAPVYAFYADKGEGVIDLVYFFWYPYNRGKSAVDTIWGNHVGDWEHITVRLLRGDDESLSPAQVYLSAHSFGGAYDWLDVERYDETHPVVYSAWGSHGLWRDPGDHVYMTIGEEILGVCATLVCIDLVDRTDAGIAWDTWQRLVGFDYGEQTGLGGAAWPVWMDDDFTAPGPAPAEVPGGGPIYRWGDPEDCSTLGVDISDLIGVCRLEDGPTGPVSKGVWGAELQ